MALFLLLLLLSALPIIIIFLLFNKPPRTPPGPTALPFIGNLHQVDISKPHVLLANHAKQHGPIMLLNLARLPVLVLSSADVARDALKSNDTAFAGRPHTSASSRLSYGQSDIITTTYTDYWRRMRKTVVHHLFGPQKMRSLRAIREQEVSRMIAEVTSKARLKQEIEVGEIAMSFTRRLLCRITFGEKVNGDTMGSWVRFDEVTKEFWACISGSFVSYCLPFGIGWVVSKVIGTNRRVERVFKEMDRFYQRLIDEHLSPNRPDSMRDDILDLLIQLKGDESAAVKIDWKHIKAILMVTYLLHYIN